MHSRTDSFCSATFAEVFAQKAHQLSSSCKDSDRIYTDHTDHDIVYIETPFENYDLTGLSMLSRYKNHPFVLANVYFYLLDTTTVGYAFGPWVEEYRSAQRPASNVCAFGRGVLENFGANFDQPLSKLEGAIGWKPNG
eukprot:Skav211754  [mRNA]  locus=scaffold674:6649:8587:+ [translate_table: standard]